MHTHITAVPLLCYWGEKVFVLPFSRQLVTSDWAERWVSENSTRRLWGDLRDWAGVLKACVQSTLVPQTEKKYWANKKINGDFPTYGAGTIECSYAKKMNLDTDMTPYTKINSEGTVVLNVKWKTLNTSWREQKICMTLGCWWVLKYNTNSLVCERKIDRLDFTWMRE